MYTVYLWLSLETWKEKLTLIPFSVSPDVCTEVNTCTCAHTHIHTSTCESRIQDKRLIALFCEDIQKLEESEKVRCGDRVVVGTNWALCVITMNCRGVFV